MIHRWSKVPTIDAPGGPWPPCVTIFVHHHLASKGSKGYWFQSYGPFMALYADIAGFIQERHIKLRQFRTCGMSLSHNCMGKSTSVEAMAAMNVSLNVWMARSVAFTWWLCGLTSCNSHSFSDRIFWCTLLLGCPLCSAWAWIIWWWVHQSAFCMPWIWSCHQDLQWE